MTRLISTICIVATTLLLGPSLTPPVHAQEVTGSDAEVVDGPFAPWGFPTPPGAEDYIVNQVADEDLDPQGLDEWHTTPNPQSEVVPGEMRSDIEDIPAGFGNDDADRAEVMESQLSETEQAFRARPGCGVYWPAPFEVCGAIKELYDKRGGPTSFLSLPKSNELPLAWR